MFSICTVTDKIHYFKKWYLILQNTEVDLKACYKTEHNINTARQLQFKITGLVSNYGFNYFTFA